MAAEKMLTHMQTYHPERMQGMSGRRGMVGRLKQADGAVAMRFVKNRQAKAAQARRVPLTEEQWQRRREAIGSTQSSHEQAVARVAAVTETDRRRAVVFEQTFPGQTSRARMFWSARNEVQLQSGVHQYCPEMDIVFLRVSDANSHVASEASKRTPSGPA